MDKKIGKLFFLCLFAINLFGIDQSVNIYIKDSYGKVVRQAALGDAYIVEVVAKNIEAGSQPAGLDPEIFSYIGPTYSQTNINGKKQSSVIYKYRFIPESIGKLSIGPIYIQDKTGSKLSSDAIVINVADTAQHVKPHFIKTSLDKSSVYIGEQLRLKIQFYFKEYIDQIHLQLPKVDGIYIESVEEQHSSEKQKFDDIDYFIKEWIVEIYPEKIGTLIIPSVKISFLENIQNHMFSFFGMQNEKNIMSKKLSVDVNSLPERDLHEEVAGVGRFDHVQFELAENKGLVGEGIVATFTLEGDKSVHRVKHPKLRLEEGLHYYESESSVKQLGDELYQKKFEYVIQATQPLDLIISEQRFIYFDPSEEKYKSLSSDQAGLIVIPSNSQKQNDPLKKDFVSDTYLFKLGEIDFVNHIGYQYYSNENLLQRLLFFLIVILVMSVICISSYMLYIIFIGVTIFDTYWYRYLYVRYYAKKYHYKKDVYSMYQLFKKLSDFFDIDIQSKELSDYFSSRSIVFNESKTWDFFYSQLLSMSFSKKIYSQEEKQLLLDEALFWIVQLLGYASISLKNKSNKVSS